MFVYYDSDGNQASYIQASEMTELLLEASDSYWTGKAGFAQIEWQSFGDYRIMQLVCVPGEGFQLSYRLGNGGWIVAVNDKPTGKSFDVVIGGENIPIDGHEIVSRAASAAIVGDFLERGLPLAEQKWERLEKSFDLAELDQKAIKIK